MNKFTSKLIIVLALFCSILKSQINTGVIKGYVTDKKSNDTLIGAIVSVNLKDAVTTNIQGFFNLSLSPGSYTLQCNMIGYKIIKTPIEIKENQETILNISLDEANTALDEVVISASKFEQKLSDITVSMDIIKPSLIENKNVVNLDVLMNQVPGVTVADGQASIRGGTGFSYGAGSRVLMLVDEMPMISADAGDIKWNFLPLESVEQVEVIKGAASALFGSSALNGVINLRTVYAKDKPITHITTSYGSYDAPSKTYKWWKGSTQVQKVMSIMHAQKIDNLDLVIGANIYNDNGFRMLETEERERMNVNLKYNFKKIPGLAVGLNTNMMNSRGGLFFLWQNYDSAYIPQGKVIQLYNNIRLHTDPFITYLWKNNKLSLRNRYFKTINSNDKGQGAKAELYYSELQFQKHCAYDVNLTTGAVYMEQQVLGDSLYGKRSGKNIAGYIQADKKFFKKLTVSVGLRGEYYKLDTAKTNAYLLAHSHTLPLPFQPVARIGLNYHAFEYTFFRASYGQGYRFPTVAEKFINTSVSALKVYPNNGLQPERGSSAEIGVKQGFKIAGFKGFFDAAAFYTRYENTIEFVFNIYKPGGATGIFYKDIAYAGFKSQNVGESQITGYEFSVSGTGKIGPINVTVFSGYTYMNPIYLNFDPIKDTLGLPGIKTLKYRSKHLLKSDIQLDYKMFSLGYSTRFQSKIENIDRRFTESILHEYNDPANGINFDEIDATYVLPGLKQNFGEFQKSVWVHDARISCKLSKAVKLSFIVNNFTNVSYQARPGDLRPPTQYVGQLSIKI